MPEPTPHATRLLRSLSSTLVGRADELAALADGLESALQGEARAVEIVGEAGIGKTALLDALADTASRAGAVVLRGRTAEFERDVPFGPVLEA
ncbi:MAG: DUF2791 family P-loop domain-containing protein, partial [Solirubrobacteraceae bacterium]|nr:DUF2791 family P-loop domain-containing protein [Solirubrobacteraceae bacterium]